MNALLLDFGFTAIATLTVLGVAGAGIVVLPWTSSELAASAQAWRAAFELPGRLWALFQAPPVEPVTVEGGTVVPVATLTPAPVAARRAA